jgi:hypothetical protein
MNKKILLALIVLISQLSFSQVGIGTATPSASSALEIKSSNSGLLIPRVALISTTDTSTIISPATSLLVYNLSTSNDVAPGFYYWDGSWKTLKGSTSATANAWNLTGNTTVASDYLGTNNYNSLVFKVNNNQFGKFHPNGGITIGNSANANDNSSIAIGTSANASTSNQAVAIGNLANASGYQSMAFGLSSLASNNSTIALGNSSNVSGHQSIGIGLSTSSTTNNTLAVGNSSRATGQQATAIGFESNSSGQNATAIGYQAVASQSNSVILGSSSNGNNKIGIGTNTPDERLHVAGSVKIVDGTQANNYVLTSDANGKASWKDPNGLKAFGEIYRTSNLTLPSGIINFGTNGVSSNVTLNGDNIQVQVAGIYRVSYTISLSKSNGSGGTDPEFYLTIYGTEIPGTRVFAALGNGGKSTVTITKMVSLAASQTVSVYSNTANNSYNILANGTSLSIELIKYV